MNLFDKAVSAVSPQAGLDRLRARTKLETAQKFLNSGYSEGGASMTKRSMRGNTGISLDPLRDIDMNKRILTNRSRTAYMNDPVAHSVIRTSSTNIVGSGLRLKARIDYDALGLSEDEAEAWENTIEREFALWADTNLCDALRLNNFYEIQDLMLKGQLMNGNGYCLFKFQNTMPLFPYGLRLHVIEDDRVSIPSGWSTAYGNGVMPVYGKNPDNGNLIYSGIEIDQNGSVIAYHICSQYPYAMVYEGAAPVWTRVEAFGELTGLPNVFHLFEAERAEQYTGVPILAPVLEQLTQLGTYINAQLKAALVDSLFTVFVKSDGPSSQLSLGEADPASDTPVFLNENEYAMGSGNIIQLAPGEDIEKADSKQPGLQFQSFTTEICKYIGAGTGLSYEELLMVFNSSYSASRAAMLETWKTFRSRRERLSEFCQAVYEQFLYEAVVTGRVNAPGFFDDPIARKAWCGADWNGPAPSMIDPTKEVQAALMRIGGGLSSRNEETIGLTGGDFQRNVKELKRENAALADAGAPLNPITSISQEEKASASADDAAGKGQ